MGVSKVVLNTDEGERTLVDLGSDTVTPETLGEDETAHDANGNPIVGIAPKTAVLYTSQSLSDAQKAQARKNIGAISEVDVPKKGIDYWTEADQEAIVQQVISALGTPVFGTVDADNKITLSVEHLADGTYYLGYEDKDGNWVEIGALNRTGETEPTYTNVLPLAVGSDGKPYNGGQGWKTGYRLNSSGAETTMDGMEVTGFIPVKHGDIVRLKNIGWTKGAAQTYAWCYDSNFNYLAYVNAASTDGIASEYAMFDSSNNLVQFTVDHSFFRVAKDTAAGEVNGKIAYFRINCADITANSVITVNQEIM